MIAALILICFSGTASAQAPSYEPWRAPGDPSAGTEGLLRELTAITDAAERDRAASPDLLADLRGLIARYSEAWPVVWFSDDFADGDFTRAPGWTVITGHWAVDPAFGLRSDATPMPAESRSSVRPSPEQVAADVIGALLDQRGLRPVEQPTGEPARSPTGEAIIELAQPLSNPFSISLNVADHGESGSLEARVYQTATRQPGYRLVIRSAPDPSVTLYRRSRSGTAIIGQTEAPVRLTPGALTPVVWNRDRAGTMTVSIDSEIVLRASDALFRDGWDGFLLRNAGGNFAIGSISAAGEG